jgi:hypothetical protein
MVVPQKAVRFGADLSPIFSSVEFAAVGRKHLYLADPSVTRSPKEWTCAHGPLNEASNKGGWGARLALRPLIGRDRRA